LIQDT